MKKICIESRTWSRFMHYINYFCYILKIFFNGIHIIIFKYLLPNNDSFSLREKSRKFRLIPVPWQNCKWQAMLETKTISIEYIGFVFSHSPIYFGKLWPCVKDRKHVLPKLTSHPLELSGLLHSTGQLHTISCSLPK